MPLYQWRCPSCGRMTGVEFADHDALRTCCGVAMRKVPQVFHHDAWGGPRYIRSLDRTFTDHAELKTYQEVNGIRQAPSADKHGGARNESHLGLGKLYSFGKGRGGEATSPGRHRR